MFCSFCFAFCFAFCLFYFLFCLCFWFDNDRDFMRNEVVEILYCLSLSIYMTKGYMYVRDE